MQCGGDRTAAEAEKWRIRLPDYSGSMPGEADRSSSYFCSTSSEWSLPDPVPVEWTVSGLLEATGRRISPFRPLMYGWSAVALFFVVSGFVIHLSFLNSKASTTAQFYWRRFWRIYPSYFFAMVVAAMGSGAIAGSADGRRELVTHAPVSYTHLTLPTNREV